MKQPSEPNQPDETRPAGSEERPVPQLRAEERQRHDFERAVGDAERRKVRARRRREDSIWFGLGTFGLIGWSVALPTLIGLALGLWLDARFPQRFSWTLALLFAGIALGCLNAWYWVSREREEIDQLMHDDESEDEDAD